MPPTVTISPGVHHFTIPTPFPVGPINCYLLEGDLLTLIDTGPKTAEARSTLEACLAHHGYSFRDIRRLILTHGHVDHFGWAATIRQASDCEILCHREDLPKVNWADHGARMYPVFQEFMRRCGFTEDEVEFFRLRFAGMGRYYDPIEIDTYLDEGQVLQAGDHRLQVVHTPGHCRGLVSLINLETTDVFTADFLLPKITPNPILDFDEHTGERYLALPSHDRSLAKAESWQVRTVLPGHGSPQDGHERMIRMNRRHHSLRKQVILDGLQAQPRTVRSINDELFPNRPFSDTFLTISETIGHIDLLLEQGSVELDGSEKVWIVRALSK